MVWKCVGVSKVFSYKRKDGTESRNFNFYGVRNVNPRVDRETDGLICQAQFMREADLDLVPGHKFIVGHEYNFLYDDAGSYKYLSSIEDVTKVKEVPDVK